MEKKTWFLMKKNLNNQVFFHCSGCGEVGFLQGLEDGIFQFRSFLMAPNGSFPSTK